jgi:hypothetical protein
MANNHLYNNAKRCIALGVENVIPRIRTEGLSEIDRDIIAIHRRAIETLKVDCSIDELYSALRAFKSLAPYIRDTGHNAVDREVYETQVEINQCLRDFNDSFRVLWGK